MIETLVALVLGFGGWVVALILMTKSAELYKKYSKNQKPEGYYVGDPNGVPLNWGDYLGYLLIAIWLIFIAYVLFPLLYKYVL